MDKFDAARATRREEELRKSGGLLSPKRKAAYALVRPFSREEGRVILRYLKEEPGRLPRYRGMTVWKEMAAAELLPGRSAHTLSGRFRKLILPRIREYDLSDEVRAAILEEGQLSD